MKTIYALGVAVVLLLTVLALSRLRVAAEPSAPAPVELAGAVRLADGRKPPNGARVTVHPLVSRAFAETTALELERAPEGSREAAVVDGKYRITLPQAGVFAVAISAPGASPHLAQLYLSRDTKHDVRLSAEGFSFTLDLQDIAQTPLAEAEVSVYAHHGGQLISRTRSDARGRVSLQLAGGQYRFVFHAAGFVPHARSILVLSNEHRPLALSRAATLDVKVAGATGETQLIVVDGLGRLAAVGRTKEAVARFAALPAGQYQVWAGGGGLEGSSSALLSAGQAASIEVAAQPHSPLRIPLPAASCAPRLTAAAPTQDGRTLQQRLPFEVGESDGARWLTLHQPPLELRASLQCGDRVAHFQLPANGAFGAELVWQTPHEVHGRVVDPDGRGLAGAVVSITSEPASPSAAPWQFTAISQTDGVFRLRGVPEGKAALEATHPRFGRIARQATVAAAAPPHELRFNADHYVSGKVLDADGAPVARATVAFASPLAGNASQTSDAEGGFRIGPVGAEQGLLVAFVDGRRAPHEPLLISAENRDRASLVLARSPSSEAP